MDVPKNSSVENYTGAVIDSFKDVYDKFRVLITMFDKLTAVLYQNGVINSDQRIALMVESLDMISDPDERAQVVELWEKMTGTKIEFKEKG